MGEEDQNSKYHWRGSEAPSISFLCPLAWTQGSTEPGRGTRCTEETQEQGRDSYHLRGWMEILFSFSFFHFLKPQRALQAPNVRKKRKLPLWLEKLWCEGEGAKVSIVFSLTESPTTWPQTQTHRVGKLTPRFPAKGPKGADPKGKGPHSVVPH